jgi:hypothetical protein
MPQGKGPRISFNSWDGGGCCTPSETKQVFKSLNHKPIVILQYHDFFSHTERRAVRVCSRMQEKSTSRPLIPVNQG